MFNNKPRKPVKSEVFQQISYEKQNKPMLSQVFQYISDETQKTTNEITGLL